MGSLSLRSVGSRCCRCLLAQPGQPGKGRQLPVRTLVTQLGGWPRIGLPDVCYCSARWAHHRQRTHIDRCLARAPR